MIRAEVVVEAEVEMEEGKPSVMRPGTASLMALLRESSKGRRSLEEVWRSESENLKICCESRKGGQLVFVSSLRRRRRKLTFPPSLALGNLSTSLTLTIGFLDETVPL